MNDTPRPSDLLARTAKQGALSLLALSLTLATATAQDVAYSPPVGGITMTFSGAVSGVPKLSTATPSLRLAIAPSFVGRVIGTLTAVTTTTLTDSQAGWGSSALSQVSTPYFIKVTSGTAAGTWWQVSTGTPSTSTSATVTNRGLNPVAAGVSVGDAYEIVPADTLSTFFGGLSSSIGGVSAAAADLVQIHDGVQWREYYFNTTANQWREGTSTFNRSNTIIRPDGGFVYIRRNSTALSMVMLGRVATSAERMVIATSGVTPIGSVFPATRTLGSLNIQNTPGFAAFSGSLATSDKISVFDGISWRSFHYNSAVAQWREGTSTFNRNTFPLPFNAPLIVERAVGASAPIVVTLVPPYSL